MVGHFRSVLYLLAAALVLVFVAGFLDVFLGLNHRWNSDSTYSYGMLVPFISAYLVWRLRPELAAQPVVPLRWALPAVLLSLLLAVVGISGSIPSLARLAIPLLLLASVLYFFGWRIFRLLFFPLGFLVFMLPLPSEIQGLITPWLQQVATQLGTAILQFTNYPASMQGNIILVGDIPMNVAEACSGLRYIFPLLGVGLLYAYLFEEYWWKRVANVLVAIPIAIFMNGVRIAGTGMAMTHWGVEAGSGIYHDLEAYLVLGTSFFLHFLFSRFLRLFPPYMDMRFPEDMPKPPANPGLSQEHAPQLLTHMALTTVLLIVFSVQAFSMTSIPRHQLAQPLERFPLNVPGWVGQTQKVPERIVSASGAQQAFSAVYQSMTGGQVDLYVGYQDAPFAETSSFFHSPSVCLPGSGWETLETSQRALKLKAPVFNDELKMTEQLSLKNGQKILTQYWFQTNEGADSNAFSHQLRLATLAMKRENTHDLFIRVITPIGSDEEVSAGRERLQHFVERLQPLVISFFGN